MIISMYGLFLLIGLLIGSFLNVCICRIPDNRSIVFPASHCPTCKASLKPRDLVPVLSWLLCRGRCRYCGEPISVQYPIIESLNAILYVLLYIRYGLSMELIFFCILGSTLLVIAAIDFFHEIIPDRLNLLCVVLGGVFVLTSQAGPGWFDGLLGLLLGGGLFLLIAIVTNGAMGGGDIKLMGALGLWFGWKGILLIMFLSFILGAVLSIGLIILKIKKRNEYIPFGPFISLAAWIVILYGDTLFHWYMSTFL